MNEKQGVPKTGTFVEAWNETAKEDRRLLEEIKEALTEGRRFK
ncbi:MAG: hypothetical protein WC910_10865 [Bacteroidales bacterium]|jgi:hypothetical protein